MKGVKAFSIIALLIITLIAMTGVATAVPVSVEEIKLDGNVYVSGDTLHVERGEKLDISVKIEGTGNASNVEIRAFIAGYEYSDHEETSDSTHIFDIENGITYVKKFDIQLPSKLDQDSYKLRLFVADRDGTANEFTYNLKVGTKRHALEIKDVVFSPENKVRQGGVLLSTVRVKNAGERDEDGLRIKVAIPELDVSASDYIDEIEAEETKTSEELLLRIPKCAAAKDYKIVTSIEYDESYETIVEESTIRVQDSGICETASTTTSPKTIITVGPEMQDVVKGQGGAIYPLTLSNAGSTSKTFTITAQAGDWANVKMSPSNVVTLGANEAKAVYVYVSAKDDASAGEHMFAISVKSGEQTLKEIALKANVVEPATKSSWDKVKKGLEVGLVVLVVLLVILGLIIGFNRLKADDDDEDLEAGQTYY